MTYQSIYIPPKKTTRWWHTANSGASNAKSIAHFFSHEDVYFHTYASIFGRIGKLIRVNGKNSEYYKELHDILCDFLTDDIRRTYGKAVSDIIKKYLFNYRQNKI